MRLLKRVPCRWAISVYQAGPGKAKVYSLSVYALMYPPNRNMFIHLFGHLVQAMCHALSWKLGVTEINETFP